MIEVVNLNMSAKGNGVPLLASSALLNPPPGTVLRADVAGHIQMRAYLSGTPECRFGLNDKLVIGTGKDTGPATAPPGGEAVELDDCQFHQCVNLNDFETDRSISFVPPDGEFELMR